ncbi:sensor histidine kinase [Virgisporangium aurantiacum]
MPFAQLDQRRQSLLFDLTTAAAIGLAATSIVMLGPGIVIHGWLMAVALVWRRRWPVAVFGVVAGLAAGQLLLPGDMYTLVPHDIAVLVAMYSVVKYADRPVHAVGAGAVCLIGSALAPLKLPDGGWYLALVIALSVVVVWLLGWSMRTRRLYVDSLEDRAATAERERDHLARIAVAEERARIARELHDMVAHSLSVMIVHADGATLALDRAPDRAREALRTVSDTGRGALVEMRHLVTVLKSTDGAEDARTSVTTTLDRARAAGLSVRADVSGGPAALPAGVELAAFRIVQESVTNALKHAGPGASAALRLAYSPVGVEIDFRDDGEGGPVNAGGHGLIGMRERVALYGGTITAGPDPAGGWRVTASIPVEAR